VVLGECNAISTIAGVVLTLCNEGGLASPLLHPYCILLHFASEILKWSFLSEPRESVTCSDFFVEFFSAAMLCQRGRFQLQRSFVCKVKLQIRRTEEVAEKLHEIL
jgi:hypothetical protein